MIKVFLDANVLYSNAARSLFIWLHINKVVQIYWSHRVWEEAFLAFAKNNGDELEERFRASMLNNVLTLYPECMVRYYSEGKHDLRDKNDNHVVSAASKAEVDFLLTFDLKLIGDCHGRFSFSTQSPDHFLVQIIARESFAALKQSTLDHYSSLKTSKPSWSDYVKGLERSGLIEFAKSKIFRKKSTF